MYIQPLIKMLGLEGDIRKAFEDGKPIIIEGIHLDLSLYDDVLETALKPPVNPGTFLCMKSLLLFYYLIMFNFVSCLLYFIAHMPTASDKQKQAGKPLKKTQQRKHHAVVVPFFLMEGEQDHKCLVESKLSSCDHPYKYVRWISLVSHCAYVVAIGRHT